MPSHENRNSHAETLARLAEQAEQLRESEGWRRWLESAAKFRTYSLRNQLLILAQRPDATRVAGYRAWQQLGRQVRKGEHGLKILAPCVRRSAEEGADGKRVLVGFRVVSVFDVAQTDGEPLPEHRMPDVAGAEDGTLLAYLLQVAERDGITVEMVGEQLSGARGWWDAKNRTITLVESYPIPSQTRTLLHELAHSVDVPNGCQITDARAAAELVAESAAYLVGSGLGLDMAEASTFYVASWGLDAKALQQLAQRVLDVAGRLEELVSADLVVAA